VVSWGPIRMGTRKGLHMRICFWSIPGGSSSSCFCCDSLLDQRPLVRSTRALSKLVQCLFLLFLSFLFSYSFLLFGRPPSYPSPIRNRILSGRRHGTRAVRVLLPVAAAFVAAHWSGFLFYFSLLISPCDWGGWMMMLPLAMME